MSEEPHIAHIKRHNPAKLVVTLVDGERKVVPMPGGRKKWAGVSELLEQLPWTSIECQDAKGGTLGVVENADDDYADDDADDGRDKKLAKLLVGMVRDVMSETRKMFEAQIRGNAELVSAMVDAQRAVQESYGLALKVQAATIGGEGGDPEVKQMLQMALALAMQPKPPAPTRQLPLPRVSANPSTPKPPKES